jgi:hypothetical protein
MGKTYGSRFGGNDDAGCGASQLAFSILSAQNLSRGFLSLSCVTSSLLTINNVKPSDAGSYTVMVANGTGSVSSAEATLTIIPPTPPSLDAATITPNGFSFQLSVPAGPTYVILASTNLQDWTPIYTNVAQTASVVLTDTTATNASKRFYRAMTQ